MAHRVKFADGAAALIDRELKAYQGPIPAALKRQRDLMAVTFVRRLAISPESIPFDSWDLMVLQVAPDRDGMPHLVISSFRPVVDLTSREGERTSGTGRISFARLDHSTFSLSAGDVRAGADTTLASHALSLVQALEDNAANTHQSLRLPTLYWVFDPWSPPVLEPEYSAEEWAASEVVIEGRRAWPASMFVRSWGNHYKNHPVDGSQDPFLDHQVLAGAVAGSWCLRDGISLPNAQDPAKIRTYLAPFMGRTVRSPGVAALRSAGLIPRDMPYYQWAASFTKSTTSGTTYPKAQWLVEEGCPGKRPLNAAAQFWDDCEAAMSDGALIQSMIDEAEILGQAAGLVIDPKDAGTLLDKAWMPRLAPGLAQIQIVRSAPMQSLVYSDAVYDVDLSPDSPIIQTRTRAKPDIKSRAWRSMV